MGALPFDSAYCGATCTGSIGSSYCTANVNSTGSSASALAFGTVVLGPGAYLYLKAEPVPADRFGYFLMSEEQGFVPLFGGSQGNLCLGLPIVRFASDILFSGPPGVMGFLPDLANLPQGVVFLPGDTWNFQCWFRDEIGGTPTSNTSDGLSITWQ